MSEVFFSDMEFPGQYYGVLVRSPVQRGRLVDIKPPKLPDNYYLYTATDIPGENRLTAMGTAVPIFTPYEIQYFGEPLGILVGPDLSVVTELVADVLIETETLEPLTFGEKFTSAQVVGKRIIESGDPDSFFERLSVPDTDSANPRTQPRIFETILEVGPQDHYYAEPLGVLVAVSANRMDIYAPSQWPFHVRSTVSAVLDLDPEEIVVTPTALGESLDGKIWFPSLLASQAALAAVLCKHPVKISFSRHEDFLFSLKSAPVQIRNRTALAEDGTIDAMIIRILINAGAYSPLIYEIIDRVTIASVGLYALRSWRIETYALRTNLPPMGALAGWGESPALLALENHIARITHLRGIIPTEWKLQNLASRGFPGITGTEPTEEFRFVELFHAVCAVSDFSRKYTAFELLASRRNGYRDGTLRGIGISCGFQGNGFLTKDLEQTKYAVEVTMETDGRVSIKTGFNSAAMQRILSTIASDVFGLDIHQIYFSEISTLAIPGNGPETLSSKLSIIAPLVRKCCETIQKKRFRNPLPITVKKAWKASRTDAWNNDTLRGTPFVSTTPGVCVVELELDPLTYEPSVCGIWIACDAGELYDRHAAESTIKKTVPVSVSKMIAEHIIIHDGKMMPKDSMQYDLLLPSKIPELSVLFLESSAPARGVGSIANNLVPAAYAAAIAQITGFPLQNIPVDAQTIFETIRERMEHSK